MSTATATTAGNGGGATKEKVLVYLYDLSHGMAKNLSMGFLGKQIDGIWHTGIVVYGYEYYYGGGIQAGIPGQTIAGTPTQVIDMGETSVSQAAFHEFLRGISHRFTPETYSLLKHNCNNFTDECSKFLTSTPIPPHITGLPEEALNTPMGMMFRPMIENMEAGMRGQISGMVPWGSTPLDLPPLRGPNDRRPFILPPTSVAPKPATTATTSGPAVEVKRASPSPSSPSSAAAPPPAAPGLSQLSPAATVQLSTDTKHKSYEMLIKLHSKKV